MITAYSKPIKIARAPIIPPEEALDPTKKKIRIATNKTSVASIPKVTPIL